MLIQLEGAAEGRGTALAGRQLRSWFLGHPAPVPHVVLEAAPDARAAFPHEESTLLPSAARTWDPSSSP